MLSCFLKRVLPFMITLMIGAGLWSIFGVHRTVRGGGGPGNYRHTYRQIVAKGSSPLRILSQPERRYTAEALENRTTGVVKLLVRFNPDGTTTVIEQISTLPYGLTEEAERMAEQTRFIPATLNGQSVAETKEMNYIFSLGDHITMDP